MLTSALISETKPAFPSMDNGVVARASRYRHDWALRAALTEVATSAYRSLRTCGGR
jgi:hypothetical protein